MNEFNFMQIAYNEAKKAFNCREVPIGCVIELNGEIIGTGFNKRVNEKNVLAHAEIIAINEACKKLGDWRLEGATLYVTVEPCPMCAGAIVQSRIKKVVFGARNPKAGCAGSILNILQEDRFNHQVEIVEGVMVEECADLMKKFFKEFRVKKEREIHAHIFDFDGTVADSCYVWAEVDRIFFAKRGMEVPSSYLDAISTMSFKEGAIYTKTTYNIKESVEQIMSEWHNGAIDEYEQKVSLKPYVKAYIARLKNKGLKIGLATASNPEYYMPVLKKYGMADWFDFIVDGTKGLKGKDTPQMYLACAEGLGVKPKECVVYEDIYKGIKSAKFAGMMAIGVKEEHNYRDKDRIMALCDRYIEDFGELLENK